MALTYRELPSGEWTRLAPFFLERHLTLPHPQLAKIAVAEDDGEVVGFLTKQLIAHVEPLSIAPAYRGKVNWLRLAKMLDTANAYVFADSPERERMLQLAGFTKIPSFTVWKKE